MWKIKVLIQFVLSKLPMGERFNFLLQKLNKSHSLIKIEERIIALIKDFSKINEYIKLQDKTVVEIGTGWDAINPILLYILGVNTCHTYDHIRHVRFDLVKNVIKGIQNQLNKISEMTFIPINILNKRFAKIYNIHTLDELFRNANIIYHAPGDATNTGLQNNTIDLVYSHAVLEHVPVEVIYSLTNESKRILKKEGLCYHLIGLHDHYAGVDKKISKVNFLKYPEWLWKFWVCNKFSYHNRMREKQFLDIFKECGADILWLDNKIDSQDIELLKHMRIDKSFDGLSLYELAVYQSKVIFSFIENL